MSVELKAATPSDLQLLLALSRAYYDLDHIPFEAQRTEAALRQLMSQPAYGRLWLVDLDGEPVGYVALTLGFSLEYGGVDAFIDELYLNPSHRGRGYGSKVLQLVEAEARGLAVRAVHLEVERANDRAHRLYLRHGYVSSDRHLLTKRLGVGAA